MSLDEALERVGSLLLDHDRLVRAVGSGRRKGQERPPWRRVRAALRRPAGGAPPAGDVVRRHPGAHRQPRAGRAGRGRGVRTARPAVRQLARRHHDRDRAAAGHQEGRARWCTRRRASRPWRSTATTTATRSGCSPPTTRCWWRSGISDREGRVKPSRQAKYRQVEEFLRLLDTALRDALEQGQVRTPTPEDPLRVVDLGCGNAYLTFAAHRFLSEVRGLPVRLTGVDVREQSRAPQRGRRGRARHRRRLRRRLDRRRGARRGHPTWCWRCTPATPRPTTRWRARSAGGRRWCWPRRAATTTSPPSCAARPRPRRTRSLVRHGILRERFADTLTDALRASLLRLSGYRVDVVQFVESRHTPRNTMLRAVRTGGHGRRRPARGVRRAGRRVGREAAAGGAAGRAWHCVRRRSPSWWPSRSASD